MLAVMSRTAPALSTVALLLSIASTASAQYYYDPCNICAQPAAVLQPVTETVYREVPVTSYRTVQRTVQKPVVRTAYEDREVTAYRQVVEPRVAEVPTVNYQNVTECRQVMQNRSYWQTNWQPVPKVHPLQYDPSPTLAGAMNRFGYSLRMAVTPNYIPQQNFVPNVVAYNVPVTRTVAIPGTRQVTYNVARMEPYKTTQRVAVQRVEYVEDTVTAYEPFTEMKTVAVGTTTRYALVDPATGTRTTMAPTPDNGDTVPSRSADRGDAETPRSSSNDNGGSPFGTLSYPQPKSEPTPHPTYLDTRAASDDTAAEVASHGPSSTPTAVRVAGWRPSRDAETVTGPELSVAAR